MSRVQIANSAERWLALAGKHPVPNGIGGWRWVLPDSVEESSRPEMLPRCVFDRLYSFEKQPWNFTTPELALLSATMATIAAFMAGEFPPE